MLAFTALVVTVATCLPDQVKDKERPDITSVTLRSSPPSSDSWVSCWTRPALSLIGAEGGQAFAAAQQVGEVGLQVG
ncbi:hypothetical protein ACIQJT_40595 [Streptomyces sp. NPDC091972]|uniref:hypothetical protein n=1 Tax=Streptomyces sp. NPDC091972 TaxID=3366007 RepID=UPI003818A9BB